MVFKIREEQLEVFRARHILEYKTSLLEVLRNGNYPELDDLSAQEVLTLIQRGIDKAALYGVDVCYDVTRFVEAMVEFGEDFDTALPWAAEVFNKVHRDGTEKMDALEAAQASQLKPRSGT